MSLECYGGVRTDMPSHEHDRILEEQKRYYRARAGEYDHWFLREGRHDLGPEWNAQWFAEVEEVRRALAAAHPGGAMLELACGTGLWTRELIGFDGELTAIDSSPEVLARNRARPGHQAIRFLEADLFDWTPDRAYDFVFFAFWLSHVPPERFERFWEGVRSCLAPGGSVFFVDSLNNLAGAARSSRPDPASPTTLTRTLEDGREYRIVKIFHEPRELEERLASLGWRVSVRRTANHFLFGSGEAR